MNARETAVLEEYAERERAEREALRFFDNEQYMQQRDTMLLGIGPEAGQFLSLLIRVHRPRTIVEAGTAFGYSTLWLAEAAACVGAIVTTVETVPEKSQYAAAMLRKAGLLEHVRFLTGDATVLLNEYSRPIDFALIDTWKDQYIPVFDVLYPKLSPGAIVCADNMLFPGYMKEVAGQYTAHVRAIHGAESMTVPVGSGVEFSIFPKVARTSSGSRDGVDVEEADSPRE